MFIHFQIAQLKRHDWVPRGFSPLPTTGDAVRATLDQIKNMLSKLDVSVPRLLTDNDGMDFWIEYLQRADAIKEQAGLDNYEWVTRQIDQIPMKYGVLPPSHWMCC
jgi:hypothetical protein